MYSKFGANFLEIEVGYVGQNLNDILGTPTCAHVFIKSNMHFCSYIRVQLPNE